jgi:hypothetical protein
VRPNGITLQNIVDEHMDAEGFFIPYDSKLRREWIDSLVKRAFERGVRHATMGRLDRRIGLPR